MRERTVFAQWNPSMAVVKRTFDIILSILLLIVCLPLLIVLLVWIFAEIKSSPIFIQKRLGLGQKPFCIFKLTSMYPPDRSPNATSAIFLRNNGVLISRNSADVISFLTDGNQNPRVSRSGKFLRRYNLDELPQLLNIFRGDMSFVGPRPFDIGEFENGPHSHPGYSDWAIRRHEVRPGLTGLWQVEGRNTTSFDELIALDLRYVEKYSFSADIGIMIRTLHRASSK